MKYNTSVEILIIIFTLHWLQMFTDVWQYTLLKVAVFYSGNNVVARAYLKYTSISSYFFV